MRNGCDDKAVDWLLSCALVVFAAGAILGAILGTVLTLGIQRLIR